MVDKDWIADGGDYNLSGERYRENDARPTVWPMAELRNVAHIESGSRQKGGALSSGVPSIGGEQINNDGDLRLEKMKYVSKEHFTQMKKGVLQKGDVLLVKDGATTGKTAYFDYEFQAAVNEHVFILRAKESTIPQYLYRVVRTNEFQQTLHPYIKGIIGGISLEVGSITIPLPPLEVQRELVAEIESYQRVLDGARIVVDNWQPRITVDPEWPLAELGDLCTIVRGSSPRPKSDPRYYGGLVPRLMVADITRDGMYTIPQIDSLTEEGAAKSRPMKKGEVIITVSGNPGLPTILAVDACIHDGFVGLRNTNENVNPEYLYLNLLQQHSINGEQSVGAVFKNLTTHQVKGFKIPLPPLEVQRTIVAELGEERAAVDHAQRLASKMEQRIQGVITRMWEG